MNKIWSVIFIILSILNSLFLFSEDSFLKRKMLNDLESIRNTFDVKYALAADYKKNRFNLSIDDEFNKIKNEIETNQVSTIKDYQVALKRLFKSFKDYHVGVSFYSTESASLPFRVQSAEGRYFISWIDPKYNMKELYLINVGDELIEFDDVPIQEAINNIKAIDFADPLSETDQIFAEMCLTKRFGCLAHNVPKGPINVTIKSKGCLSQPIKHKLEWIYFPELISNKFNENEETNHLSSHAFFNKNWCSPLNEVLENQNNAQNIFTGHLLESDSYDIETTNKFFGGQKSFLPYLGESIWCSSNKSFFHAYIFKGPNKKNIGYIRIPDYKGDEDQVSEFKNVITHFQRHTEALVIDQLNNPGGYGFYMYALLCMLANKPLDLLVERSTLDHQEVFYATEMIYGTKNSKNKKDNIKGFPFTPELIKGSLEYAQFIIDQWNAGNKITESHYSYNIDKLYPDPKIHYTKPIVVLINQLDFSAADLFPAILQDNKRAIIFGANTAGAGGAVDKVVYPNMFGIASYSYTSTITERINQQPIENQGVTPDVQYSITVNDLENNYVDYVKAINETLRLMLTR